MFLKVDPKKALPIYVQIIEQIKFQIASGRLQVGDRLPTVRELALSLKVNPNTVAKAYRELDRDDILEGRPGQGSFVKRGDRGFSVERRIEEVSRMMETPVVHAYHLNLAKEEVRDIFTSTLASIYKRADE